MFNGEAHDTICKNCCNRFFVFCTITKTFISSNARKCENLLFVAKLRKFPTNIGKEKTTHRIIHISIYLNTFF